MRVAAAFALAATSVTSTAAHAEKPVELSAIDLSAAQSHTYQISSDTAFSAVVAALQSLGYVDINASKDAGTISGQTEAKGKIFYNILWGFGKKKLTQKASLLVEPNGTNQSLVRLNLHVSESKQRGIFGTAFSDGKLVKTAEPYATFFAALDAEVNRRAARASASTTQGPVGAPTGQAATSTAAAATGPTTN